MAAEPKAGEPSSGPLKLRAEDVEDIAVISAVLQDALVAVGEMIYQPEEKRFVLIANRFRGETSEHNLERVRSGVRFDEVASVSRNGFRLRDTGRILVLLAIRPSGKGLRLDFAGGPGIRLETGRILCHLEDLGEPWPTKRRPRHSVESGI